MSLAEDLIKKGVLKNERLIEEFRIVDRKNFVPEELNGAAYIDEPLPIGDGQTISQPWTVAFMLELLDPKPGENIMEIGYGSGWQTALILACGANVWAIERIPALCEFGKKNIEKWLSERNRSIAVGSSNFFCQDGTLGLPDAAKEIGSPRSTGEAGGFDKIIVAAALGAAKIPPNGGTASLLPETWHDQLKIGGKIIAPVGHSIFEFVKKSDGNFDEIEHAGFSFVPLVSGQNGRK